MRICGKKVRELREEREYSLQELARKAAISISYLSEIERGAKNPSLKTLGKIAMALNVSQEHLVAVRNREGIVLGQKLRMLRQRSGKNLSVLAQEAGISISYLSEIERGNVYPAIDTLKKLSTALDVPISSIVGVRNTLGHKLRQAREEQGLTQADLARAAGVSAGLIGQIEHGKVQPSLKTLESIGKVLDISPCYFIADASGVDDVISQMSPELRLLLTEPRVQSVLRMVCNCTEEEMRFILNFIQLYKRSH